MFNLVIIIESAVYIKKIYKLDKLTELTMLFDTHFGISEILLF